MKDNAHIVEKVAKLARIEISQQEKEILGSQLAKILEYVEQLNEVNTQGVAPMRGLHTGHNVFREDVPRDSSVQADILSNAPAREGDYFKVPQVIE